MKRIIPILLIILFSYGIQAQILDSKWKIKNGFLEVPDHDDETKFHSIPVYNKGQLHYVSGTDIIYYVKNSGKKEFKAIQEFYRGKVLYGQKIGPFVPDSKEVGIGGGVRNKVYDVVISKSCGNTMDIIAANNVMIRIFLTEFNSIFVSIINHCSESGI